MSTKTNAVEMNEVLANEATQAVAVFSADSAALSDATRASSIAGLMNPTAAPFFCSIKSDGSRAARVAIYNAINGATDKVDDHINEVLSIVDVAAHTVQLEDEQTGEMRDCVRVVLIGEDGKCYAAVSEGVVSSLTKIFQIVGRPHWDEPIKVKPMRQAVRSGFKTMVLALEV